MGNSGIYKIQSIIKPERYYVGSAVNIRRRWNEHLLRLKINIHHSEKLQRHFNKYGESDLIFIVLEPCFPEFLIAREQYYIDKLEPFFNSSLTAGSILGFNHSEETKQKMRKPKSEETKKKMRKPKSKEARLNMSRSKKGKKRMPLSPIHIKKISIAAINVWAERKKSGHYVGHVPWNKGLRLKRA